MRQDPSYFILSRPNFLSQTFTPQAECFASSIHPLRVMSLLINQLKCIFAAQLKVYFLILSDPCIHLHVLCSCRNDKLALIYFLTHSESFWVLPLQREIPQLSMSPTGRISSMGLFYILKKTLYLFAT